MLRRRIVASAVALVIALTGTAAETMAKAKKPLTGVDRLWQEYKRRHPGADRDDFSTWLGRNKKATKAVVDGKGAFRYGGYVFTKTGARKSVSSGAAARRAAGEASKLNPRRYSQTGKLTSPTTRRLTAAQARQYERQIRSYMKARGSPLARYASKFVEAGDVSGFDPRFLAAISVWETGAGTAIAYPQTRPYNFWNWNNTDAGAVGADSPWQSVDTAFKFFATNFGEKYPGSNLMTDFGPYATDPSWESKIAGTLAQMGGDPRKVRFAGPQKLG